MSLRANSLFERIRDLTLQSDSMGAGDLATREVLGREVLQALLEIDRATKATPCDAGAQGGAAGGSTPVMVSLASQSPVFVGALCGATDPIRGAATLNAASLIGAPISIRLTGRQRRRV